MAIFTRVKIRIYGTVCVRLNNTSFDILGRKVKVVVRTIDEEGYFSPEKNEIVLSPKHENIQTLVHELAHAYFEISGLRQDVDGGYEHMIIRFNLLF